MVYLDYNATYPPDFTAIEHQLSEYKSAWGNASGLNAFSQKSKHRLEAAHGVLESYFKIPAQSLTFTSSGTEAVYHLVFGYLQSLLDQGIRSGKIVTSRLEHPAVTEALLHFLKNHRTEFELFYFATLPDGKIGLDSIDGLWSDTTRGIFCILVQNETGVIQPVTELLDARDRFADESRHSIPIFSDTIQAIGKLDFPYHRLDGFTIAGHKIGTGIQSSAYYANPELKLQPIFKGGNQEDGKRAGSENLLGITTLAKLFSSNGDRNSANESIRTLRDWFETEVVKVPIVKEVVAQKSNRVANTSFLVLGDIQLDFLLMFLDQKDIAISTGTSCKSQARAASPVLESMGYQEPDTLNRIRISIGAGTKKKELSYFIDCLNEFARM